MAKGKSETPSKGHSQKGEQRGHEHFEKGSKSERLNEGKLPDFKHTPPPPPPPKKDGNS